MVGRCAIRNINFYRERLTSKWLVVLLVLAEEGEGGRQPVLHIAFLLQHLRR